MRLPLFTLAVLLAGSSYFVHAKMYKWVDDEGQMHFGDKIPKKYLAKEHDELNEHGMKAKHQKAEKTVEEKAEEKRLKEEREKAQLAEEKKRKLDRVLLDAYDSESDLIVARDARLNDVAFQIQLAESNIKASNKKIESIEKQIAQIKKSKREVPANLYSSLKIEKEHVATQNKILDSNKKRSIDIANKYNDYVERFRAAKSQ